jgi:hypothetical protein
MAVKVIVELQAVPGRRGRMPQPVTQGPFSGRSGGRPSCPDQSDTFDSLGYSVAEQKLGVFHTSDEKFANAARSRRKERVRFIR